MFGSIYKFNNEGSDLTESFIMHTGEAKRDYNVFKLLGFERHNIGLYDYNAEQIATLESFINTQLASANNVLVLGKREILEDENSGHAYNITGFSGNILRVINPWGKEEFYTIEELAQSNMRISVYTPDHD